MSGYKHGLNGYTNFRCRCEVCRFAWAAWNRRARMRRSGTLAPDDPRHGKYTTYGSYRCRCEACRSAWAKYSRAKYSRREPTEATS